MLEKQNTKKKQKRDKNETLCLDYPHQELMEMMVYLSLKQMLRQQLV